MGSVEATELTGVLNRVKTWPTTLRVTLAPRKSLNFWTRRKCQERAAEDTRVIGGGGPGLAQNRPASP